MGFHVRRRTLVTALAVGLVLALPGIAQAESQSTEDTTDTTVTTVQPLEVVSTLPVLGSGLTVSLTRDETGAISTVGLDPDDPEIETVEQSDHRVVFLLGDGSTEVVVKTYAPKSDDDGSGVVKTSVKADATDDVTGPGTWTADVFGNGDVVIPYTVSFDGLSPSIAIGDDITLPEGVTAEVGDPKVKTSDDGGKYVISVLLTNGDQTERVTFSASTRLDDGETKVRLSVTLSGKDHGKCGWGHHHRDDTDGLRASNADSGGRGRDPHGNHRKGGH